MSALLKSIVIIVIVIAVGFGVYQSRQTSKLKQQASTLQQDQRQQTLELSNKVQALERDLASAVSAQASNQPSVSQKVPNEALRLRGEVGRLRLEKASLASSNAISKVTAN